MLYDLDNFRLKTIWPYGIVY